MTKVIVATLIGLAVVVGFTQVIEAMLPVMSVALAILGVAIFLRHGPFEFIPWLQHDIRSGTLEPPDTIE